MEKVAFIDLDGVLANSTARFELARATGKMDWNIAFAPEHVALDTLIEGTPQIIEWLHKKRYTIIFLTSRPEAMREATNAWIAQHVLDAPYRLIMKPKAAQYLKTPAWKAAMIETFALFLEAEDVVVIDDEQVNREALTEEGTTTHSMFMRVLQTQGRNLCLISNDERGGTCIA